MNIAFPAVVVVLLTLPGVLFNAAYRKGVFPRTPFRFDSVQNEILKGLAAASLIHVVGVVAVEFTGKEVDFSAVLALLAGWPPVGEDSIREYVSSVTGFPLSVFAYVIATSIAGAGLGISLHLLVRCNYYDLTNEWLRFDNEWYYLFSGERIAFEAASKEEAGRLMKEIEAVFVSVVVEQGDQPIIYWGVLSDYFFRGGELDRIELVYAERRRLCDDTPTRSREPGSDVPKGTSSSSTADKNAPSRNGRFYPIEGDYFVIRSQHIKTINVDYLQYEVE